MKKRQSILIGILALVFVMGASCSRSQILTTLTAIVTTAEIALPSIAAAAGTPPETVAAIDRYLQAVGKATAAAADILSTTLTPAEKSARITLAFAGVAKGCNCIKPGTPERIINVTEAVAQAVLRFLNTVSQPGTAEGIARGVGGAADVNSGEKKDLAEIRLRSLAIVGQIELKKEKK